MTARRLRRRSAGVTLFFFIVLLPIVWVVGALSVDYGRVVSVQNRANTVADAASLAAVNRFRPACDPSPSAVADNRCLDEASATQAAQFTVELAEQEGATRGMRNIGVQVTFENNGLAIPEGETPEVTVEITYEVTGLVFLGLLDVFTSGTSLSTIDATSSRTAYVCDPQVSEVSCIRPR